MSISVEQMVQREVMCCMSSLVSTLTQGYGLLDRVVGNRADFLTLSEQAFELSCSIIDYEEAARQAGWEQLADYPGRYNGAPFWKRIASGDDDPDDCVYAETAQEACEFDGIEPYEWEVYEHWAVSPWLAEKLIAQGERVDTDFAGLCVWARTTTGQGITCDSVIQRIHADMIRA